MNVAVKECVAEQLSKSELNFIKKKSEYEGKVFNTKNYGDVVVLEYTNNRDITVKCINTNHIRKVGASELRKGEVRDNELDPIVKVGVMDVEGLVKRHEHPKSYVKWNAMLQRCYNEKELSKHKTYVDCIVSEDFKYYSKFKEWFEKQIGCDQEGWHLDKDILVKGNKVYSAETCCFVPQEINCLIHTGKSYRGLLPQGVVLSSNKKRYRARVSMCGKYYDQGTFDTPEEAFMKYKEVKEAYIKEVADKYKDVIDHRVYKALYAWTIGIDE